MAERRQDTHRLTAMNTVMALYRNGEDILIPDHMSVIDTMKMKPPARMTMRTAVDANFFSGVEFGDIIQRVVRKVFQINHGLCFLNMLND